MIEFQNQCCDCASPGYPCTAPHCSRLNVPVLVCDRCGDECDELYEYDGEEMCEGCLLDAVPKVRLDD